MAGMLVFGLAMLLGTSKVDATAAASLPAVQPATVSDAPLPTPQFRRYGTADGLPSTNVYAVVQAPDGAIWFGTKGGIARFDGVRFRVFRHIKGVPGSLYNNGIDALLIDRRGQLWAAGLNAGINRYDAATGRFRHWGHVPADPRSLSSDRVWAMAQTGDGSLWVGTSAGLDRMLPGRSDFEHVRGPQPGDGPGGFGTVTALHVDGRGRLWIGCDQGVFWRGRDGRLHPVLDAVTKQPIAARRIDGTGDEVRIATADGLMVVGADGLAHRFGSPSIPPTNVMTSIRDAAGRLWVGTQKGLFVQMKPGAPVTPVSNHPVLYGNLPGTWVWQIMTDREGGLWIALLDGGVAYLAPGWNSFSRFTHIPDDPASLRDAMATTMAHDRDGRHLWVGERRGRVDRLDPVTGKVDHVISGLGGDVVGMTEDARHRLWVAVRHALFVCAGRPFHCRQVDLAAVGARRPLEVEPGPGGSMYARTFGHGVFRIDPDTLAATPVPMDEPNDKVLWGTQMTYKNGVFWYASDGGMMRSDAARGRLRMVAGVAAGTPVDAFTFGPHGIWMANEDGLTHYHFKGRALVLDRSVDARHGWPSVSVVDLRVDVHGRVWIFGHDGLWCFDPATGKFRTIGLEDGLTDSDFTRGYALMPSGYLYAPTLGGVVGFDPDHVRDDPGRPHLLITRLTVTHGKDARAVLAHHGVLRLGWRDHHLSVQARAFSYLNPRATRYCFMLKGFDNAWVDTGSRGIREFIGLKAGDYTLDAHAFANGHWTTLATPLRIHVQAPPWLRWWAWLVYAALAAVLAWVVLLAWRRRMTHRHQILMVEQQRSLAEQASAAKSQFLATLSHEIRTPMTGVLGMAELLLATSLNPVQHSYAETMQRSGELLLKLLNDALDLARIESGKLVLEPAPFDPFALVQDIGRLQTGHARAKGLEFDVEIENDLPQRAMGDAFRIRQILLNLANNALKFTEHGSVVLAVGCYGDELVFRVSDTGPGIPMNVQAHLFEPFEQGASTSPQRRAGTGLGLSICRELALLMGGRIALDSRLGEGSTFRLHLPLQVVAGAAVAAPRIARVASGEARRILLVEDDAIVASVILGLLERMGHAARHVANGLEAIAELSQSTYDLVLMDLDLPGLDGFQIVRLIRQHEVPGEHLVIIAVTARTGGNDEARCKAAGMDGFLRKPLTGDQLAAALAAWPAAMAAADSDA
ncbi:two-component regulator propeller domain-containing protein [Dyella sp. A6]|uniref:hybrid sensor histidine kinase/response regulator n=1 Tax=Dyella aluminiiresistens TaxID=3069105 RepID=UPI002E764466|nr:two-component regulator propeller domain-containing protein [Dyella sp. A6]